MQLLPLAQAPKPVPEFTGPNAPTHTQSRTGGKAKEG